MKSIIFLSVIALEGIAAQQHNFRHLHHVPIGTPRPIEFHGLAHLDLDEFKPPVQEKAFSGLAKSYETVEQKLRSDIEKQVKQVQLVEKEFLDSDLHKEALAMKLRQIV